MTKSITMMNEVSLVRTTSLSLFLYFVSSPLYGICILKLRTNANVSTSRIVLEDVVEAKKQDDEFAKCMDHLSIDLGPSPLPGRFSILSADDVKQILSSELGPEEIQLEGPKQTKIFATYQDIDPSSLISFVQASYNHYLSANDSIKVNVMHAAASFNQKIRPGYEFAEIVEFRDKVENSSINLQKFLNPNQNLRLKITYPDQSSSDISIPIRLSLEIQQKVVFLNKDISAASIVQKEDLFYSWVNYQRNNRKYFLNYEDVVGKRAKVNLNFENPILQSQIEGAIYIKSGTIVDAVVRRGNMKLYIKLKALNSGFEGSSIDAISLRGNQRYKAKVLSSSRVEVL